jgi:hypothetical protein
MKRGTCSIKISQLWKHQNTKVCRFTSVLYRVSALLGNESTFRFRRFSCWRWRTRCIPESFSAEIRGIKRIASLFLKEDKDFAVYIGE